MASGSLRSVSVNKRTFVVSSDNEASVKLGGYEKSVEANGDGQSTRDVMTVVPWSVSGLEIHVLHNRGDQEFLQEVCDNPEKVPVTVTYVDHTTIQGVGTITGELAYNSKSGLATVNLMGQGKMKQQ